MPLRLLLVLIGGSMLPLTGYGQSFEPLAIRYFWLPQAKVQQADDEVYEGLERQPLHAIEAVLRLPLRLGNNGFILVPSLEYHKFYQTLNQWPASDDAPRDADLFGLSLSALLPLSDRWSLLGNIGVDQGTNKGASWSLGNNLYKGGVGFLLNMEEGGQTYKMGVTLFYSEVLGFPIALLVYRRVFSDRWSVDFALPRYGTIDYNFTKNTKLRLEERFTAGRFAFDDTESGIASYNIAKVTMTAGVVQRIRGPLYAQAAGGFTIWNRSVLFNNSNERLDVLHYTVPQLAFNVSLFIKIDAKDQ